MDWVVPQQTSHESSEHAGRHENLGYLYSRRGCRATGLSEVIRPRKTGNFLDSEAICHRKTRNFLESKANCPRETRSFLVSEAIFLKTDRIFLLPEARKLLPDQIFLLWKPVRDERRGERGRKAGRGVPDRRR